MIISISDGLLNVDSALTLFFCLCSYICIYIKHMFIPIFSKVSHCYYINILHLIWCDVFVQVAKIILQRSLYHQYSISITVYSNNKDCLCCKAQSLNLHVFYGFTFVSSWTKAALCREFLFVWHGLLPVIFSPQSNE